MGLLDKIKADVKKSGQNKGKFIYFREGQKTRIRFLSDMDDGMEVIFHDSYEKSVNIPCQDLFGRECPGCEDTDLRTRSLYIWSVYNYESKEVQLFMFPVNNCSPIPALTAIYENYGTLTDRDYIISVQGKQQNKTYSVVPMDKVAFRNTKVKPYTSKAILKMLDAAFPCESDDDEDLKPSKKGKSKRPPVDDDFDEDEEFDDEDDADGFEDYESMSVIELFKLCKERNIDVPKKKSPKFYIRMLREYDEAHEDWDDEDEDEDFDDDD